VDDGLEDYEFPIADIPEDLEIEELAQLKNANEVESDIKFVSLIYTKV
jgi:hypothetical protein